jgi:hypothetical protein
MNQHPDQLIDQVLQALRDTQAPEGLEARIAARLAQAAEPRTLNSSISSAPGGPINSFLAVILDAVKDPRILFAEPPLYLWAAIAFILAVAIISTTFVVHRHEQTTAQWNAIPNMHYTAAHPSELTPANSELSKAANQASQGIIPVSHASLGSHPSVEEAVSTPDLDAIALAETQAPSHPAPPMPLTAQERLLIRATRPGQPIELAELDTAREPALRSLAQARERATLRQYIHSLLGPLAMAEALNPTPSPSASDEPPTTAPTDPPSSK